MNGNLKLVKERGVDTAFVLQHNNREENGKRKKTKKIIKKSRKVEENHSNYRSLCSAVFCNPALGRGSGGAIKDSQRRKGEGHHNETRLPQGRINGRKRHAWRLCTVEGCSKEEGDYSHLATSSSGYHYLSHHIIFSLSPSAPPLGRVRPITPRLVARVKYCMSGSLNR